MMEKIRIVLVAFAFYAIAVLSPYKVLFSADLTVDTTTYLSAGTYTYDNVVVNSTLVCKSDTVAGTGVTINCNNLTVNSSGRISADGQGYIAGQGPGAPVSGYHGGMYGGLGGGWTETSAYYAYGSISVPTGLGSGAGPGGGSGGGAITIIATNEVRVEAGGIISSNGNTSGASGGSGGSVYIRTKTLSGEGEITALGGNSGGYWNGANGGGGRIAIYYEANTFNFDKISARQGTVGNFVIPVATQGTIFLKSAYQQYGDLLIDAKNYAQTARYYTPIKGTLTFDTIYLKNIGCCLVETGASVTVTNVYSNSNANILMADGDINKNGSLTVNENVVMEINNYHSFNNVTVKANGKISHSANYDSQTRYRLNLEVYNDLTIEPGGSMDVTAKGFIANTGPGKPISSGANGTGGSYGGKGGCWTLASDSPGNPYGSETAPLDLGSGGKSSPGAGAIYLFVWNTLDVDGSILAEGYSQNNWSIWTGSGGSVYIKTPNFTGSTAGKISVKGGSCIEAGGGGGRVAVYYHTYNYKGIYDTAGGAGSGGGGLVPQPGTKYTLQTLFYLPPRIPVIDNPAYSSPIAGKRPSFKWTTPTDQENDNVHFEIQVSQDSGFVITPEVSASTDNSVSGFQYSYDNGVNWQVFPSSGVSPSADPAVRVMFTSQQDLGTGNWYFRVRAKDVDGSGQWSNLGYLPSIVGDLVVKINSPQDSVAVYDDKIMVSGVIQNSVSYYATVNMSIRDLTLTDSAFSFEVNLNIGKNIVSVTGTGAMGNTVSDNVSIYRLRVPETISEGSEGGEGVGSGGGTIRLEDYDGNPDNDARIEIAEGAVDRDVKIRLQKIEGNYPVYEITVDGREHFTLKKRAKLVFSYKGMRITGADEDRLRIFVWDGVQWRLVGGQVDKTLKVVVGYTNHFSRYAVMVAPAGAEKEVNVSPLVITPNGDGINDAVIFNFVKITGTKAEIKIYDSAGKTVRNIEEDAISDGYSLAWDGREQSGGSLESGAYAYTVMVSGKIISSGTVVIAR